MQDSLRRVLRQLRPQVLDTHGLREELGFGPLREMLEDAGEQRGFEVHSQIDIEATTFVEFPIESSQDAATLL